MYEDSAIKQDAPFPGFAFGSIIVEKACMGLIRCSLLLTIDMMWPGFQAPWWLQTHSMQKHGKLPRKHLPNCKSFASTPLTRKTTCNKHGFPCAEAMALGLREFHWLCGLLCQRHLLLLIFYCRLNVCFSCSLLSHECLYHYCLSSMLFLAKILMEIFIKIVKFCLQ